MNNMLKKFLNIISIILEIMVTVLIANIIVILIMSIIYN